MKLNKKYIKYVRDSFELDTPYSVIGFHYFKCLWDIDVSVSEYIRCEFGYYFNSSTLASPVNDMLDIPKLFKYDNKLTVFKIFFK